MLLHLQLASSLSADGVHGAVVAQPLDVGHASGMRDVDGGVGVGGAGSVQFRGADERRGVSLVSAAAVGVLRLVDRQHAGVAVVVLCGDFGGGLGFVEGHGRRRRVEGTKTLRELFHGDAQIRHVHAFEVSALSFQAVPGALLFGGAALHGVDRGGQGKDHILCFLFRRLPCGEYRVEGFGAGGGGDGG